MMFPRRSVSQIFQSNTPHEQKELDNEMFPSMQPSRPKLPQHRALPPMNQQQTRTSSTLSQPPQNTFPPPPPPFPRNQIEAMPPTPFPLLMPMPRHPILAPQQLVLDASKRHPVFFTERLKKAPAGVQAGNGNWCSPVATGYVWNDGVKRKVEGNMKL